MLSPASVGALCEAVGAQLRKRKCKLVVRITLLHLSLLGGPSGRIQSFSTLRDIDQHLCFKDLLISGMLPQQISTFQYDSRAAQKWSPWSKLMAEVSVPKLRGVFARLLRVCEPLHSFLFFAALSSDFSELKQRSTMYYV